MIENKSRRNNDAPVDRAGSHGLTWRICLRVQKYTCDNGFF